MRVPICFILDDGQTSRQGVANWDVQAEADFCDVAIVAVVLAVLGIHLAKELSQLRLLCRDVDRATRSVLTEQGARGPSEDLYLLNIKELNKLGLDMVEREIVNRYTDRGVFSHQNRNEARATNTATNRVKTILLKDVDVGCQFRDGSDVGDK